MIPANRAGYADLAVSLGGDNASLPVTSALSPRPPDTPHKCPPSRLEEEELDEPRRRCGTQARAERFEDATDAADEAEARAREKASKAAASEG